MIKLSRLTDYAVVILAAMAGQQGQPVSASVLSGITSLPEPTVSKILKLLAKAGIIYSIRGVNGGYALNVQPDNIMVSHIITAIEGPIALTGCVDGGQSDCAIKETCPLCGRWNVVNAAIKTALDALTLTEMLPSDKGGVQQGREAAGCHES